MQIRFGITRHGAALSLCPLLILTASFASTPGFSQGDETAKGNQADQNNSEPDTLLWKNVAGWQIRVDSSVGNGCFMVAGYERGTILRIGFNREAGNGYIAFADPNWKSLVVGNEYDLVLQFGTFSPWNAPAYAISMGTDVTLLTAKFSSPQMMKEFADANLLHITYKGGDVAVLKLTGSEDAVRELINCQDQVDKAKVQAGSDPFSTSTPGVSNVDPFKN